MGRKYKFAPARSKNLVVRLTEKEHEMFKKMAKESGKSMSQMVREIVSKEYISRL